MAAAVIGVVPVNDAPDVVLEGTVYVENATTVTLDPLAAVTDIDDAELSQVVIQITSGGLPGDFLTANGGATGGTVDGITFIYDTAEHAMVLTGASSVLNYQTPAADGRIPFNQRQPDGLRRGGDTHPDVDRIGRHGGHDHNDDTRYPGLERRSADHGRRNGVLHGERGAGRALAEFNRDRRRQRHSRCG